MTLERTGPAVLGFFAVGVVAACVGLAGGTPVEDFEPVVTVITIPLTNATAPPPD